MLDLNWLQEVKELVELNACWNIWLYLCNIQGEIVFQLLQNLRGGKRANELIHFLSNFEYLTRVAQKEFDTLGSY